MLQRLLRELRLGVLRRRVLLGVLVLGHCGWSLLLFFSWFAPSSRLT
jgi:hypothetical protein